MTRPVEAPYFYCADDGCDERNEWARRGRRLVVIKNDATLRKRICPEGHITRVGVLILENSLPAIEAADIHSALVEIGMEPRRAATIAFGAYHAISDEYRQERAA